MIAGAVIIIGAAGAGAAAGAPVAGSATGTGTELSQRDASEAGFHKFL